MFGDNAAMTRFDVVLRGYDRLAVDALVTAVEAAAGDPERIGEAVMQRGGLPVVLRGYDRAQVDAWLARHRVAESDTGKASSSAIPGPELVVQPARLRPRADRQLHRKCHPGTARTVTPAVAGGTRLDRLQSAWPAANLNACARSMRRPRTGI
jgi:hypothetical protein